MTRIGMIGIGLMGQGIAANLVRRGHHLTVLDHPGNQPLEGLRAAGVVVRDRVADVAAAAEVVILVLTGSPAVEAVLMGHAGDAGDGGGLLQALEPGAVVIDCSTAIPASTLRMARAVGAAGGRFLDAPMTRTPKEAAEGRLNLLVGGDAAVLDECRPLLACFAENISHVGPVGAGHGMKLLHNFVSLGMATLLAEAAACAQRSGVAAEAFVDVLAKGGGGGVALERLKPYLLRQDPSGLRFSIANACKDLGYYATMAHDAGAHQAIADAVLATLRQAPPEWLVPELVAALAGTV
jgi:3-hydroxyisobutyrate dehydrogenase-like beta-hydroxyacid dehydrogenase